MDRSAISTLNMVLKDRSPVLKGHEKDRSVLLSTLLRAEAPGLHKNYKERIFKNPSSGPTLVASRKTDLQWR